MQLGHRRTQRGGGLLQCGMHGFERGIVVAFTDLVEVQARRQQRLQRAVVQMLGDLPVMPLVGLHRLRHQLPADLLQLRDARPAPHQHQTQCGRGRRRPQQEAEVGVDDVRHADGVVALGVHDPHRQIAQGGAGPEDRGAASAGPGRPSRSAAGRTPAAAPRSLLRTPGTAPPPPARRRPSTSSPPSAARDRAAPRPATPRQRRHRAPAPPAYMPGSQWSTSHVHTSRPINAISGSRRKAVTRTGSAAR